MIKSTFLSLCIIVIYFLSSSHTAPYESSQPVFTVMPCQADTALTSYVIATDVTIAVAGQLFSTQSILENSNVTYKSGSGTTLAYGTMTGSLSGPSPGFQIFNGSTLTINIEDCM